MGQCNQNTSNTDHLETCKSHLLKGIELFPLETDV